MEKFRYSYFPVVSALHNSQAEFQKKAREHFYTFKMQNTFIIISSLGTREMYLTKCAKTHVPQSI